MVIPVRRTSRPRRPSWPTSCSEIACQATRTSSSWKRRTRALCRSMPRTLSGEPTPSAQLSEPRSRLRDGCESRRHDAKRSRCGRTAAAPGRRPLTAASSAIASVSAARRMRRAPRRQRLYESEQFAPRLAPFHGCGSATRPIARRRTPPPRRPESVTRSATTLVTARKTGVGAPSLPRRAGPGLSAATTRAGTKAGACLGLTLRCSGAVTPGCRRFGT